MRRGERNYKEQKKGRNEGGAGKRRKSRKNRGMGRKSRRSRMEEKKKE